MAVIGFFGSFALLALFRLASRSRSRSIWEVVAFALATLVGALNLWRAPSVRPALEIAVVVLSTALCAAAALTYTDLVRWKRTRERP